MQKSLSELKTAAGYETSPSEWMVAGYHCEMFLQRRYYYKQQHRASPHGKLL